MKNILAQADVTEKFDQEFAIYDLPEFLRAVDLFDKSDLKFNGGQNLTIADSNSKQSIKYYFADKSVVVAPTKMINMPDKYVTFALKKEPTPSITNSFVLGSVMFDKSHNSFLKFFVLIYYLSWF